MSNIPLGQRLRAARLKAGLTQSETAARLGVTYQAVSNYERGKCRVDAATLRKLCILYHASATELLESPEWDESVRALYAEARSPLEKLLLFEMHGVPADLAAEYEALRTEALPRRGSAPALAADEAELLALYRRVPQETRALVFDMIRAALKNRENG